MQMTQFRIALITTLGLFFLGACNSGTQTTTTTSSPAATATAEGQPAITPNSAASPDKATTAKAGSHGGQGGQIIESGPYHLELVTVNEADGTHIDFFFQHGDNHDPIPNAKVTAQVQLPDGSQKSLAMKYDANDKHYTAILPGQVAGDYKVAILTDINGEKVNGRFNFKR